jgi:hypothetical protein
MQTLTTVQKLQQQSKRTNLDIKALHARILGHASLGYSFCTVLYPDGVPTGFQDYWHSQGFSAEVVEKTILRINW